MNPDFDPDFDPDRDPIFDPESENAAGVASEEWWLTAFNRFLVWARLRVMDSGVAQVFDSTGSTLIYESDDIARAALMDAEFRSLDGMDDDDAEAFGILLEDMQPPQGEDDDELIPQMTRKLPEPN
jgi:hypothetical protein